METTTIAIKRRLEDGAEPHERAVFDGLSRPLPALSFEVHDFDPAKAQYCIDKLQTLGDYDYGYSSRENFELTPWPSDERIDLFGDIYAVLR